MQLLHLLYRWRHYATLNNAALLLGLLITLGWLWGTVTSLQKNFALQQQVDALDQEIEILRIETQTLGFQSRYFESDEYVELSARSRLNKAAAGETLVILPPQPKVAEAQTRREIATATSSNFEQWFRFFFGRKS